MDNIKFYLNNDHSIEGTYDKASNSITINSTHENQRNVLNIINNITKISSITRTDDGVVVYLAEEPYVEIDTARDTAKNVNLLTSFETRLFARTTSPYALPFERAEIENVRLKTDLHTHFAAALTPEQLIDIGKGKNVRYPEWLANKLGLNVDGLEKHVNTYGQTEYLLDNLLTKDVNVKKIISSMKIDTSVQETFNKMEEIYTARSPFTKNSDLFIDMAWAIARDAKADGVKYIEFSLSSVISDPKQLKLIEEKFPQIEQETGVQIRFLGALSRHSNYEWNKDEVEKLKIVAKCPYVVGCDFMGHETNPTSDFAEHIKEIAKYAMRNDPSFTIRVHAGENVLFKNNVRQVLLAIEEAHYELLQEDKKDYPYPPVRIGHGLYGYGEEASWDENERTKDIPTKKLFEDISPVIEYNLSSNLSLNNIDSLDQTPISKYLKDNIKAVLGTDGKGIYSTNIRQEMIIAHEAGVTLEGFAAMARTEDEIISRSNARFEKLKAQNPSTYDLIVKEFEEIKPRLMWTKEVEEFYQKELTECQERLKEAIKDCGAITDLEQIKKDTAGKKPIMLTGSSHSHFPKIEAHPEQLAQIRIALDVLVHLADPNKAYFVTGGTNHGIEKELHIIANEYNKRNNKKHVVLGTLTEEAATNSNSEDEKVRNTNKIEKDTITHAITPVKDGKIAKRWFDLPDTALNMVQQEDGVMIAIGGGAIVGDMILRAHNMGMNMMIMSSVVGASSDKSNSLAGNDYRFKDVMDLVNQFKKKYPDLIRNLSESEIERLVNQAIRKYSAYESENKKETEAPEKHDTNTALSTIKKEDIQKYLDEMQNQK